MECAVDAGYNAQIWICSKNSVDIIHNFSSILLEKIG